MLKLKSSIYTICLSIGLMMTTMITAQANNIEVITTDFSDLDELYNWPVLDAEKIQLAKAIHARTYGLYPTSFYQKIFNDEDYYSIALKEDDLDYIERKTLQCLSDINQPNRYEQFTRYHTYHYVKDTPLEEVKDDLQMLNYFFIDELAIAVQNGNINKLDIDFNQQLKQRHLKAQYDDFKKSSKYDMTRDLAHMEIEGSQSYSPLLMFYIFSSSAYCLEKYDSDAP